MNITPNKLSIAQLFAANNEQFIVPAYQRRYAWGYYQFEALFNDIDMLQDNDGHLFGMLILHTSLHQGDMNKPELVDGQQRITTMTILLKALQKKYLELEKEDKVSEIGKMLKCKGLDDIERNKLVLGDLDNEDYKLLMSDGDIEEIVNQNLTDAYEYFSDWISDYSFEELNKFYFKLTNVAVLIRLDVGLAKDAYKLFETINNRGLKLSPTDIIKNFLLGNAAKINENETLDDIKRLWSDIIVNLDGIDTDDFLRQYMCAILQRKITKTKLVSEFKSHYFKTVKDAELMSEFNYFVEEEEDEEEIIDEINNEDDTEIDDSKISIRDFLTQLKKSSDIYNKIAFERFQDNRINRRINNLNRILSKPTYIFLMHFMDSDYDVNLKVEVLKTIETFMLRRHICEMRTSEHDDVFSKLIKHIGEQNILDLIKVDLQDYYPDDSNFEISFPQYYFKGKLVDRAKYVLEQLEYRLTKNKDEFSINQGNEVHLEHIIPQTIDTKKSKDEFGDWEVYLGENALTLHKKHVHLIGNMTLLAGPLNILASNNPFDDKKTKYAQSNIKITKDLESYNEYKFEQVLQRGKSLSGIAVEIWSL